ncbi:porphobilinogen synthase [Parachlamydia sp. AcF125]|uniref:porphobilinogen synthase n=1 Tax=Parachlamydia sp. AcF125 TaxID=2795736 RepID=UPI001BCA4E52|nr:porphobilinogen synthase [Parachlamydia sp. AcF125]MBS4167720.1 Delta-aminolevulinic acid dehydratase [Parachlamydia sp. AcF125]
MFAQSPLDFERKGPLFIDKRLRRNRRTPAIRALVQENYLHAQQLVAPLFVLEGTKRQEPIASMPGVFRLSIDLLIDQAIKLYELGIRAVDLFPVISAEAKDSLGSEAIREGNLMQKAVYALKKAIPELCVMVDVALDPYTDHGHDGLVDEKGAILNDPTLEVLARMSLLAADAGADVIAPSDMMDGRVAHIRKTLDAQGHIEVNILAYAAKYASAFYGPFREALQSAPKFGDKKTYQLNPANSREGLRESLCDEEEGADFLLVKPALAYLDVLYRIKEITTLPVAAYHVSGEYAMIMAAAEKGWIDADRVLTESLISIKRAGADFILTYGAERMAQLLRSGWSF